MGETQCVNAGIKSPTSEQAIPGLWVISETGIVSIWPFFKPSAPAPKSKEWKEWQEKHQAHTKLLQPTFRSTAEAELQWQRVGYKSCVGKKIQDLIEKLTYTFAMTYWNSR